MDINGWKLLSNFSFPTFLFREMYTRRLFSAAATVTKKLIPQKLDESFVEIDANKLCKYVCINYLLSDDSPGPSIKPESEYPDWLFRLDLEPERRLEDLDPEKDGWKFWQAYKKRQGEQQMRFEDLKYRYIYLQRSPSIKKNRDYSKYKYV